MIPHPPEDDILRLITKPVEKAKLKPLYGSQGVGHPEGMNDPTQPGYNALDAILAQNKDYTDVGNPMQLPVPGADAGAPSGPAGFDPSMDPRLAALYTKHKVTPGGSGTGFADWGNWNDKMKTGDPNYFLNRLDADLAGTGTDQPTGTPGEGPWSRSGAQERGPGGVLERLMTRGNSGLPNPTTGFGPSMNTPNSFWNGRSPMDFAKAGQLPGSQLGQQNSDLISQLLQRIMLKPTSPGQGLGQQ